MLIISLVALLVLIFVGMVVMFRKILTQNVSIAVTHLEELNQDYAKKNIEVTKQLEEAKQKSQDMLSKSREEIESIKVETIKAAEQERDKMLSEARRQSEDIMKQAEKSRQLLISEIDDRILREGVTKACELIESVLPENFKREVHAHWVEELIGGGFSQMERLKIPEDANDAKIISAFALTPDQRKTIAKKLKDMTGKEIKLTEEIDPQVVAGLSINFGSLVLDGSLQNKIREQSKKI